MQKMYTTCYFLCNKEKIRIYKIIIINFLPKRNTGIINQKLISLMTCNEGRRQKVSVSKNSLTISFLMLFKSLIM